MFPPDQGIDADTDTGANAQTRDRIDAAACAESIFAQRHRARIVDQMCGHPHPIGDRVPQRNVGPCAGEVGQHNGEAVLQIEHARHADADPADLGFLQPARADDLFDQFGHAIHHRRVTFARQRRDRGQMLECAGVGVDHRRA
jgi:hypothetical protein